MCTNLRSRLMLLFMSLAMVLALPAMAIADTLTISNTLVTNTDTSKASGGTGTANVWLEVTNNDPTTPDDAKGCNVTSSNPGTVTLKSDNPDVTFPNGNTAQLTDCYKDATQTNAKGIAYKVADNAQAGQAILSATVTGGKPGQINQYNTNDALTVTITAPAKQNSSTSNVSGSGTYGGNATLTATLKTAAGTALSGKSVDFELDGKAVGSATTGTDGVATKSVSLSGIDAGSYTNHVSANFASDSSNNGSTGSGNLSVSKAAGSVGINNLPSNAVFGGDFTPTYAKTGDGAASTTSKTPSVCSANAGIVSFDAAGTCSLQASAAEGTNHLQANGAEQSFQIDKANAAINVNGFTGTYDGAAKGASGTATGIGGADLSGLLDLGDKFTNAPGDTANWSFAGNDNYKPASGSVAISIVKASSATKVTCPAGVTYNGSAQEPCSASVSGAGGLDQSLAVSYQDNLNAGQATAKASYAESTNHTGSSGSENFNIAQADLTVTADAKSKVFGEADPALTYQHAGTLFGNDQITGSLSRVAGETVGSHAIQQGSVTAGGSYAIKYVGANLSIKPWTFKGFYQPVDMSGTLNTVKGGSTVPIKFELFQGLTELTDTAQVKTLQAAKVACDTSAQLDDIEILASGSTALRYDTTGGQFIYNWKTPTTVGNCYKVTITANDGSFKSALFKIR